MRAPALKGLNGFKEIEGVRIAHRWSVKCFSLIFFIAVSVHKRIIQQKWTVEWINKRSKNRPKTRVSLCVSPQATQQVQDIDPMLNQCWSTVYDAGTTLDQHWASIDSMCFPHWAIRCVFIDHVTRPVDILPDRYMRDVWQCKFENAKQIYRRRIHWGKHCTLPSNTPRNGGLVLYWCCPAVCDVGLTLILHCDSDV